MELQDHSIQELANNSLIGPHRELPDSGKAELVDPFAPVAHELMTQRPSDGTSMLRIHVPRSKYTTFVSTGMSTRSWTSIDTSSDIQCAEVQRLEKVNLNQSLPPTPISENPQVDRLAVKFDGATASRRTPGAIDDTSAAVESVCVAIDHIPSPTPLIAWERRSPHLSYAEMEMEIVIPPSLPEVEMMKPLNVIKKSKECRGNFL